LNDQKFLVTILTNLQNKKITKIVTIINRKLMHGVWCCLCMGIS